MVVIYKDVTNRNHYIDYWEGISSHDSLHVFKELTNKKNQATLLSERKFYDRLRRLIADKSRKDILSRYDYNKIQEYINRAQALLKADEDQYRYDIFDLLCDEVEAEWDI